ncbi:MAG: c-type cytochrome, partial [Pyrinomonadaceae bacterium]
MTRKKISYGVCVVWLALAFWLLIANRTATGIVEAQSNSPDKPIEQVRKNIQVLKGLPASQLFPVMNFVSASLGVRCNYCHVNNGGDNWVWESDEKQTKRTARRMMQMVIDLNKNNQTDFRGSRVTCYTCHRGQTEPQHLPTLPLMSSKASANGSAEESKKAESLPTVRQVLDRYVEAVGGQANAAKLKTRVLKGIRESSQGNWSLEIDVKQPDKFLISITIPQQGIIYQGFSGTTGWLKNLREQRAMSADELAGLKQTAELYEVIKVKESLPGMNVTAIEKIGGRESYVLESATAPD